MIVYILTGYVCSVALGCDRPMPAFPEPYQTKCECEARIDSIRHNKYVLEDHLKCSEMKIEEPTS